MKVKEEIEKAGLKLNVQKMKIVASIFHHFMSKNGNNGKLYFGELQNHWVWWVQQWNWKKKKSEVTQSCPTLCDPVDYSPPGSCVHGILQARILEWVAISLSRWSFQPRDRTQVSCIAGRCFILWATREAGRWVQLSGGFWTFFSTDLLGDWDEDWHFPILWPLLGFPNLVTFWVQYFNSIF